MLNQISSGTNIDIIYANYNQDDPYDYVINRDSQARVWWNRKDNTITRQKLNTKSIYNIDNLVNWVPHITKLYGPKANSKEISIGLSDKD